MTVNRYRIFFGHFPAWDIVKIFPLLTLHRAIMLPGHLIKLDFKLFIMEILIILKHWVLLPITVFNRFSEYKKGVDISFFREKVVPEMKRPSIKAYRLDAKR
jgi:hypothetical protein